MSNFVRRKGPDLPLRALAPYLLIAFGLAWGILGLYIFWGEGMSALFGPLSGNHPLFFLAVYAPAIAALILVFLSCGWRGLRAFLGRALLWRCSPAWYAFLLLGLPLIFILGSAQRGNLLSEFFPFPTLGAGLFAIGLAAIKGPVEEFGWRGLALPLLQRKFAPIYAGLILGVIWALWHLPAFLLSGTQQSQWAFSSFFLGCLAISVIATALFNRSGGSILLSAFFHFSLMNPIFPDAQPYDTYLLLFIAAMIVYRNRKEMFCLSGSVIEVVPEQRWKLVEPNKLTSINVN
jgi:membrane protease YdiL (CAAX protease family)